MKTNMMSKRNLQTCHIGSDFFNTNHAVFNRNVTRIDDFVLASLIVNADSVNAFYT